jgi:hypothetical protein
MQNSRLRLDLWLYVAMLGSLVLVFGCKKDTSRSENAVDRKQVEAEENYTLDVVFNGAIAMVPREFKDGKYGKVWALAVKADNPPSLPALSRRGIGDPDLHYAALKIPLRNICLDQDGHRACPTGVAGDDKIIISLNFDDIGFKPQADDFVEKVVDMPEVDRVKLPDLSLVSSHGAIDTKCISEDAAQVPKEKIIARFLLPGGSWHVRDEDLAGGSSIGWKFQYFNDAEKLVDTDPLKTIKPLAEKSILTASYPKGDLILSLTRLRESGKNRSYTLVPAAQDGGRITVELVNARAEEVLGVEYSHHSSGQLNHFIWFYLLSSDNLVGGPPYPFPVFDKEGESGGDPYCSQVIFSK